MKLVTLMAGQHGVRQIASARAEAALRKLGYLPKIEYQTYGNSRPWTDEEYDEACIMRLRGMTHAEIAMNLGRTKHAVTRQIGPERPLWGSNYYGAE